MNSSTNFSQNLITKLNNAYLSDTVAWKKTSTQTKFRNKKSNSYKFISDITESSFAMTSH